MKILTAIQGLDSSVLLGTLSHRECRHAVILSRWLSRSGDGYLPVVTVIAFAGYPSDDYRQLAWHMAWLFLIERCIYFVAKNSIRRRRPYDATMPFSALIIASDKFSFPSGHTSAAVLYAVIMYQNFPSFGLLLVPWALCVGASRVVLGVHYPSDIAAGTFLGFGVVTLVPMILMFG